MIRTINREDLSTIYTLGNKYDKKFSSVYNIQDYIDNDLYFLRCFEEANVIKGFSISTIMDGILELHMLYVDDSYRNKGIGKLLIKDLELKSVKRILLEVAINNISAYNLYQKNGFKIINKRKKYYDGIDAYVMEKVIK